MIYLLDTNTCIAYLRGRSAGLLQRLAQTQPQDVALCALVKAELLYGAIHSGNPVQERAKLVQFWLPYRSLPFDDPCAEQYGLIKDHLAAGGNLIGPHDLLIAATALANNPILVTHNTQEFSRVPGLQIEDWEVP